MKSPDLSPSLCPDCGAAIPPDQPKGLCATCALKGALELSNGQSQVLQTEASGNASLPQPVTPAGQLPTLKYFGDYELLEEIARGGMGIVYKARQVSLDRIVAVKLLLRGEYASEDFIKRFRVEASAAASLQHPNIVAIHEVGVHQGQHYFAMDLVDGPNLAQLLRDGPLPAMRAAGYVRIIAEAIHFAHTRRILHRDIKPSNVLIDANDQPRVTDFGLAKQLVGTGSTPSDSISQEVPEAMERSPADSLTLSGQVLGSPGYMPPEQASGQREKIGVTSDVYSLGAILYHALTGRPPFAGQSVADTLKQVENKEPIAPRLLSPSVPRDLETICLKCLQKEPGKRYMSAEALAAELGRFLCDEPIQAHPVSRPEKIWRWCRRNPVVASLTAVIVVAVIAGTAGWLQVKASRQKALAILYANDDFLAQRALTVTSLGEARDILEGLERAIRRQPENPLLWRARGAVLERINELEDAYAHFSRAIELADGNEKRELRHDILLRRSNVLRRMQRVPEAAMDYRRGKGLPYKHIPPEALPDFSRASTVSLEFGTTNREQGLYVLDVGDSRHKAATRDGEEARFFSPGLNYGYFFVDPTFKWTLSNAVVRVEYQVVRGNPIGLHYDGRGGTYSLPTYSVNKGRTGQWEVIEFVLHETRFRNAQNGGADFRLQGNESGFYLHRITVSHYKRGIIPSRPASTSSNQLDLTTNYTSGIRHHLPVPDLAAVTDIQQIIRDFTGIDFDPRGVVTISGQDKGRSRTTNIPLNRRVLQMHFLQAAESTERDGTQIGSYVIHFSDSSHEELPLIYGRNIRGYGDNKSTPEAQAVSWAKKGTQTQAPTRIRVFVHTWVNPRPESEVKGVDFVSGTRSAPNLLAITIE
jgi:serine/threonine protein kinase